MANENDEIQDHQPQQQQQLQQSNDAEATSSAMDGQQKQLQQQHQQQKQKQQQQQHSQSEHKDKDALLTREVVMPVENDDNCNDNDVVATCARGKLNDLVADLCEKSGVMSLGRSSFGDYTNIRATTSGQLDLGVGENSLGYKAEQTSSLPPPSSVSASSGFTATQAPPQPAQNSSSFSFKRFLNSSSSSITAPSTTVTSLSAAASTSGQSINNSNNSSSISSNCSSSSLQTSTGARPKVPQSASASTSSISTLVGGLSISGAGSGSGSGSGGLQSGFGISATKMKRSPRFSSFDSQASLAEYAGSGGMSSHIDGLDNECAIGGSSDGVTAHLGASSGSMGFRLYPDSLNTESNDIFCARNIGGSGGVASNNYERQYVPRSYSNYEMPSASPRRRGNATKDARPTRLSLNASSPKLTLDLPIDGVSGVGAGSSGSARPQPMNASGGEFPPAAAAALPDFVQDHWMDSWHAHEMHLNSPPNSPICAFVADHSGDVNTHNFGDSSAATNDGGGSSLAGNVGGTVDAAPSNSKMLPDFLSDGPIIHSSQRLADVAAGLPSNSIGSPEDTAMTSQLSRMRMENERLQRELAETRTALTEQTRRANELERQLQERQLRNSDGAFNRSMPCVDESVDKSSKQRRPTPTSTQSQNQSHSQGQSHVNKLKQQVTQLTAEVDTLRRENDTLREEGAVGGCGATTPANAATGVACSANVTTAASATAAAAAEIGIGVRAMLGRPSRAHQISRDLLRAASNAESNLRQLLTGVDNLRQMAADIENSESRWNSPDLYSDFLDECDDYEEYQGGPAL